MFLRLSPHEELNNNFYSNQINVFSFFHFEQFLTITQVLNFLKPRIPLGLQIQFVFQEISHFIFIGRHFSSEIQKIWNKIKSISIKGKLRSIELFLSAYFLQYQLASTNINTCFVVWYPLVIFSLLFSKEKSLVKARDFT